VQRSVLTLFSLFLRDKARPTRFLVQRALPELDPTLFDPQNWNEYWNKKDRGTSAAYDLIATFYRNVIIKGRLECTLKKEFAPGARLLHAGCGSGQLDTNLHSHAKITAVDISESALGMYGRHNAQAEEVRHASIFDLPFANGSFDGAYNLGVVEHFSRDELKRGFSELHRVIRPDGKLVVFWPHAYASSVMVLNAAHWVLNDVMHRNVRLHPPEVSLIHSREEAAELLGEGGFKLESYHFGMRDFLVQAVVVASRC
jgi:SAM-dependent methyltransferase